MVKAMVIYPNVRHQSEGIKVVFENKMLYYRKSRAIAMVTTFAFTK
jgi:hypothetical protein